MRSGETLEARISTARLELMREHTLTVHKFHSLQLYGFVVMVSVKRSCFFQRFVLPSDTKSAIILEWIELVKTNFIALMYVR